MTSWSTTRRSNQLSYGSARGRLCRSHRLSRNTVGLYYSLQAANIADGNGFDQVFAPDQPSADHPPLTGPSPALTGGSPQNANEPPARRPTARSVKGLRQTTRTFWASSPLRPGATSNSTFCPSSRDL